MPLGKRMSNAAYHAHPALSKSTLFKMSVSPEHFRFCLDNPPERTPTLIFGSAFHKTVLEPRYFSREFVISPKCDRRTTEGKAAWQAICNGLRGRDIITAEDASKIAAMRDKVMLDRYAAKLITGAQTERSLFWTDELTGVHCKARPDAVQIFGDTVFCVDLKTCNDASNDGFCRAAVEYGYTLQAYMYTEALRKALNNPQAKVRFVFICVEKEEPYHTNLLEADELFIRHGEEQFREYIGLYAECRKSGNWYGYTGFSGGIQSLSLPAYLQKEYI